MRTLRTENEVEELVETARQYCERLAAYKLALAEGRFSNAEEAQASRRLAVLEEQLRLLNSNNALDRRKARAVASGRRILFLESRTSGRRARA